GVTYEAQQLVYSPEDGENACCASTVATSRPVSVKATCSSSSWTGARAAASGPSASTVVDRSGCQFSAALGVRYIRAVLYCGSSLVSASRKPWTICVGVALSLGGMANTTTWAARRGVDSTPRRSPLSGIDAQPASRTALPAVNTVARLVVHRPRRTRSPPPTRSLLVPGAGPVPVVVVAVPVPVVARAVRGRGRVPGRAPGGVAVPGATRAGGGAVVRSGCRAVRSGTRRGARSGIRRGVRPGVRRGVRLFRLSVRP